MRFDNDGLSIWYGTPDTPVPPDDGADREASSITVAVQPPSEVHRVTIEYRVDRGATRLLPARHLSTDYVRRIQYFLACFPRLDAGDEVQYRALLASAGRQVPAAGKPVYSTFRLASPPPAAASPAPAVTLSGPLFTPKFEFVTSIKTIYSGNADVLGETPEGLRINYYLVRGTATGPRFCGTELPRGAEFLTIRRDGIAIVSVRATFRSNDGALVGADISGVIDLGEDAYGRAAVGKFPDSATLQLAPTLATSDERYLWMNRSQFLAVGQLVVAQAAVRYDLYVLHNDPCPSDAF
jgi:Protein of unknown function (DUF3237)